MENIGPKKYDCCGPHFSAEPGERPTSWWHSGLILCRFVRALGIGS